MKTKGTVSRIIQYVLVYKKQLALVLFFAALTSSCTIVAPYIIGRCIDAIGGKNMVNFALLLRNASILTGIYIIHSISSWFLASFSIVVSNNAVRDMREEGFKKITTLPLKFFDSRKTGDLMSGFSNDIDAIAEGLTQTMLQVFSGILTILGCMIFMVAINGWIALVVIFVAPLAVLLSRFMAKRSGKSFKGQQAALGEYNGCIEEIIVNFHLIKAFRYEKRAEETASSINKNLYRHGQKAQFYSSLVNPVTRFINHISYVSVGLIGGIAGCLGGLSVGSLTSLITYSTQFAKPFNEMTGISTQLHTAMAAAERFFALLDEKSQEDESNKEYIENVKGNVTFSDVSFSYASDADLIKDFTIDIEKGSMVAIVGPTGAGKTTIVNLLMRFYELDGGKILIDGKNIFDVNRDSVRLAFGMVLQDTWLFSGTVKENIAYGRPDCTDEEIYEAAKAARAHGFITRLEDGYDTIIKEDSDTVSQGEKQLITIARAMLAKPEMLILDEATSSVDPRTEKKIQEALQTFMKGRTSFIIAHRLSTIENADLILVMDKGRIIETGSHAELIAQNGFYSKLYNSQFSEA